MVRDHGDELPTPFTDALETRAERGERPDPDAVLASARAGATRRVTQRSRARRRGVAAAVLVVLAGLAFGVRSYRTPGPNSVSTGESPDRPVSRPGTTTAVPARTAMPDTSAGALVAGGIMFSAGGGSPDFGNGVVIDPDTLARQTVVSAGCRECIQYPTLWSPDRRQVATIDSHPGSGDVLTVFPAGGSAGTQVAEQVANAAWAPNSRDLVFDTPSNNPDTIVVVDPARALDRHVVGRGRFPTWSPDGRSIYFTSLTEPVQIMRMDADGTNIVTITKVAGEQSQPAVSPDGQSLAFLDSTTRGISTSTIDGTDIRSVTSCAADDCSEDTDPVWSPDGTRLAFVRMRGSTSDIAVTPITHPHVETLPGTAGAFSLSWR